jgi:hypothetical protein
MFGCKGCNALRSENEHLRGLVDRLLAKLEVHCEPDIEPDKSEPIDEEGVERITYGNP